MKKNETTHRYATENDVEWIVDTALEVVPTMPHYRNVKMDRDVFTAFIRMCLSKPDTYAVSVLCDSHTDKPVGLGIVYCVPMVFSLEKASSDIFLYVEPKWRSLLNVNKMYANYKKWAKENGAVFIAASHTSGYESAAMDVLFRRSGFQRVGAIYHARRD
jgi:hypothetical protein